MVIFIVPVEAFTTLMFKHHDFSVHSSNWHVEHWLHFCRGCKGEATFPRKECRSPAGYDNWPSWNTFYGYHFSRMHRMSWKYFDFLKSDPLLIFWFFYSFVRCGMKRLENILQACERNSRFLLLRSFQMLILWLFGSWRGCLLLIQRIVQLLNRFAITYLCFCFSW